MKKSELKKIIREELGAVITTKPLKEAPFGQERFRDNPKVNMALNKMDGGYLMLRKLFSASGSKEGIKIFKAMSDKYFDEIRDLIDNE